jgi:diguanylate cyclase (GGDEF)-like protein
MLMRRLFSKTVPPIRLGPQNEAGAFTVAFHEEICSHRALALSIIRVDDKKLTAAIQTVLRGEDVLGHIGGEAFALLLPEATLEKALEISARIRKAVAAMRVEFSGQQIDLTVGIGVAALGDSVRGWDELFNTADQTRYRVKQAGRNRVAA